MAKPPTRPRSVPNTPSTEALWRIEEARDSGASTVDLSDLDLSYSLSAQWRGWPALADIDDLKILRLNGNAIAKLPLEGWRALGQLSELTTLDLSNNPLVSIPDEAWRALGRLTALEHLDLSNAQLKDLPPTAWEAFQNMSLRVLLLERNHIREIASVGWRALSKTLLTKLSLNDNRMIISEEAWSALCQIRTLRELWLVGNRLADLSAQAWTELGGLFELVSLGIEYFDPRGYVSEFAWHLLGRLSNLEELVLVNVPIGEISSTAWEGLAHLNKLRELSLSRCAIHSISEEGWSALARLSALQSLILRNNLLRSISNEGWDALSRLPSLRYLDLSYNSIREIALEPWARADRFAKLALFPVNGNPLPEDLLAAADRGRESFLLYLRATGRLSAHPRTVKLLLLGEPASGKTTLVEALKGNPKPCDPNRLETIGVNVQPIKKRNPDDRLPMYLSTWDFAGQHMEYATHQFFLRSGGIYLILWKARMGSDYGQKDMWYWLELLKMRVKDPEFLLVTTHTALTPSRIDLAEIQKLYPGCKGHFEIELSAPSDRSGIQELESKILELAAASPNLKAAWPAPWLAVRNAVREMRAAKPYIPASDFWKLCAIHRVELAQHAALADQLDTLGEIVYYSTESLARFVILDPTWVTELVAKVVRDKTVQQQRGALHPADLDRIWGNLPEGLRTHLENLMDEYDLVYKPASHDRPSESIVVEALPPAPEETKSLDVSAGRAHTAMIYRFPSLNRHLPPGVPTWAFARARRYIKPGAQLWRNAARFEDPDTNSEAVVVSSEIEREVRLRVAADYPPYFFGVIDSILRDTFKRYPGAQPEKIIPCPCRPSCKHGFSLEGVIKRKRDGKTEITCQHSFDDVAIEALLTGFVPTGSQASDVAFRAEVSRKLTAIQNSQNEELISKCPSMFTLAPPYALQFHLLDSFWERAILQDGLELVLYCEWEKQWHPTKDSVYRFHPEREWFTGLKKYWSDFAKVSKVVAPLVGIATGVLSLHSVGAAAKEISEKIDKLPEADPHDPSGEIARELGPSAQVGLISLESRHLLEKLIHHLDEKSGENHPRFGGLHPYHRREDGHLLWLCAEHRREYENS